MEPLLDPNQYTEKELLKMVYRDMEKVKTTVSNLKDEYIRTNQSLRVIKALSVGVVTLLTLTLSLWAILKT